MRGISKKQIGFLKQCVAADIVQRSVSEMPDGWACYKAMLVERLVGSDGVAVYRITDAGRAALAATGADLREPA